MRKKTRLSEEDFGRILSNYNLGGLRKSRPFPRGLGQTTILLVTTKGKYVLRYYENRSERHVIFEVNLLSYLQEKKYPVPAIVKDSSGKILGRFMGKPYMITQFINGKHIKNPNISYDKKQASEVARITAKLHILTIGYKPGYAKYRREFNAVYCLKEYKKRPKARHEGWLKNELLKLEFPELPKGICHADLNYSNFLFRKGKITAVLDFDMSFRTSLVYDVASLIYWWAWPPRKGFKAEQASHIVKEYAKHRKMSLREKMHVYDFLKLVILLGISWSKENDFDQGKKQIEFLNNLGRKDFCNRIFN